MTTSRQGGFTLTELLIAVAVGLLVTGAVFVLMTASQGSFRREPELVDRQQNIRLAMAMIQRDVSTGGAGMPAFQQIFSRADLGTATLLDSHGPVGPSGGQAGRPGSDFLEVFGNDGECPDLPVQDSDGVNLNMLITPPACYGEDQFVMVIFPDGASGWGFAHEIHGPDGKKINFPNGLPPIPTSNIPGTPPWPRPPFGPGTRLQRIQLVRYEIANDADGVPGLWRSETGGFTADNVYVPASAPNNATGFWQLIARGIEDMQVRYRPANGVYVDSPPAIVNGDFTTIMKDVEVTLWARAIARNLQGQVDANAPAAQRGLVRGSLTTVTTPRAALLALRSAPGALQWQ